MVVRVARAISKARALPISKPARTSDVDRRAARAAIEAMREPTEEMARYGSYEAENCIKEDPCGYASERAFLTAVQIGEMPPPFRHCGHDAWDILDLDAAIDALKAGEQRPRKWQERAPDRV